jgi:hypothetical protein
MANTPRARMKFDFRRSEQVRRNTKVFATKGRNRLPFIIHYHRTHWVSLPMKGPFYALPPESRRRAMRMARETRT